jgi:uncharacterized membrane protein HdeD (DUF308 family)
MSTPTIFRNWWVILIQGILMIALGILIFKNPGAVLATLALWLGIIVLVTGLCGVVAYFATAKVNRDTIILLGSIAMVIIGALMVSKLFISMLAITIAFGILVSLIGLVLISGSWNARKLWSMWWIIALLGLATLITGIESMFDVQAGAENISALISISVLLSGMGLILLAYLKKKVVSTVKTTINA